ncbi:MAG TPA: GMC family oxidoreductase [bacterium]|nr:GMC family oxidoreductase [bacterium]
MTLPPRERATLRAICRAIVPATDLPLVDLIDDGLTDTPEHLRARFRLLLRALGSSAGNLLLAGRPRGVDAMSDEDAQAFLRSLGLSRLSLARSAFHALKSVIGLLAYAAHPPGQPNPLWQDIGFLDSRPPSALAAAAPAPTSIRPLAISQDTTLSADVCVIGSGAGGSVVAAVLARSGADVLLIERGEYRAPADYTGDEYETLQRVSLGKGVFATDDNAIGLLAGIGLGGTTVINWTTSLEPPADVLQEWERDHGIDGLTGPAFRATLDVVRRRVHVTTALSAHNANNQILAAGAQALGYTVDTLPRNVDGCPDPGECGPCVYGCRRGTKQDALCTWIADAASAGARIVVNCAAERIRSRGGTVTGVEASVRDPHTGARQRVEISCRAVVLAGGAIFSPALLLRSGLGNAQVGRGLRLHPVTAALGIYDHPIEIWRGAAQTAVCTTFSRVAGRHGFWLEASPGHPGLAAMAIPWSSREDHAGLMRRLRHTAALIVLVRDRGSGSVRIARDGTPIVRYRLHPLDRELMVRGLEEMAKIHLAAGATEVFSLHTRRIHVRREEPDAAGRFSRAVWAEGIRPNAVTLFSAHLMGGLPMGADPWRAAVDPSGRLYGIRNLYVADGSLFPSAPSVNPQITIMAMAHRIAQRIR